LNTQKWNKSSLSVNASYINLAPYQAVIPQNIDGTDRFSLYQGNRFIAIFNNGI
jgi:hypothetical protein